MENRELIIKKLIKQPSVLTKVIDLVPELNQLTVTDDFRAQIASKLEKEGTEIARSRAVFILNQENGNFEANREAWGIPDFLEGLVGIEDFSGGFLWRFRAHTTSWSENQYADQWFLTSLEARSITRYEFWTCDDGPEKPEFVLEGNYKEILQQLLADQFYEVLVSPVFSSKELNEYIYNFPEDEEVYMLEEVIEDYISQNPNFTPDRI